MSQTRVKVPGWLRALEQLKTLVGQARKRICTKIPSVCKQPQVVWSVLFAGLVLPARIVQECAGVTNGQEI